jgi:hypothetical protein
MPGEEANTRIIPLLVKLIHQYHAIVTDAYDRDHSAGHLSPGHNVTGTAADMVPKVPNDAGWNMIEAMGKWAVSKGMIVGYGAGVPGSQPWPGHGRGNHIHIEFGNPSTAGVVLEQMAKIGRPVVTGGGMLAKLAQAAVDKVLKVSNNKLTETFAATQGGATDFKVGKASTLLTTRLLRSSMSSLATAAAMLPVPSLPCGRAVAGPMLRAASSMVRMASRFRLSATLASGC